MKSLILLALVALISAQNPVPVPGLNLNSFNGYWYVVWEYDEYIDNHETSKKTCETLNITVTSNGGQIYAQESYTHGGFNNTSNFTVVNNNAATWNIGGHVDDWLAVDPVSGSWALLGRSDAQEAVFLSRNPSVSNVILNAQILLLKKEGYNVNSTNQYSYPSSNCQPLF